MFRVNLAWVLVGFFWRSPTWTHEMAVTYVFWREKASAGLASAKSSFARMHILLIYHLFNRMCTENEWRCDKLLADLKQLTIL